MLALDNNYMKVSAIYKKLRDAQNHNKVIYISGAAGFGKTAAVEYFFRRQAHLLLSGMNGYLEDRPKIDSIVPKVVIFDDISWITEQESQQYIQEIIIQNADLDQKNQKQIVLIGRSMLPSWLRILSVDQQFHLADERDLVLSPQEAKKFFENREIELGEEEFADIMRDSKGYALSLIYAAYHMAGGIPYSKEVLEQVRLDLYHYYDQAFYERWDEDMKQVLLALCHYPKFTVELAEMITGNSTIPLILEKALSVGSFLEKHDSRTYSYRPMLHSYLVWKQSIICTKKQIAENYERAALYYEIHDQVEMALKYYEKAGSSDKISGLLIKNARKHPGHAHFFETREYYFSLPEQTVKESPVLMSGLSILYSITLQPEESEKWYDELKEYEQKAENGSPEKKEAAVRLAYLNIALPHRGIHGIINVIKNTAVLARNKNIKLPEFSVTSNLPSVMNGGLDFCEWSRNDKELAVLMKKPVEFVLGSYGVGLVNIALAESGYEKSSMDSYEVMTRLNAGYMMSDTSGRIEMCFAAVGLMIKEHLVNGQTEIGNNILQSFEKKAVTEHATQLLPSIAAFRLWISLMEGDTSMAQAWLEEAPDENIAFCILDRYQYMQKVRCLIALGQPELALHLVERLQVYFTRYERNYMWIENQILKAVIFYRQDKEEWEDVLRAALTKAQRYRLTKVFAHEGIALKPLLDKLPNPDIQEEYLETLKTEVNQMAIYYPNYLREKRGLKEPLTETEKKVTRLLCEGISSDEICSLCGFAHSSLKFHNKNIYRKLGVNNRTDAEREAIRLGLNHERLKTER